MSDIDDRRNHIVYGCLGWPINAPRRFTTEEFADRASRGISTPLDLVPHSFWWTPGERLPNFGEEMLGKDF